MLALPLLVPALGAYLAGLFFGFGGWTGWALAIVAATLALAGTRRSSVLVAVALLVGAGATVGASSRSDTAWCADLVARSHAWRVTLDDDAAPGSFVHGQARAGRCAVRASLAVREGRARAGDVVLATGEGVATPSVVRVDGAVVRPSDDRAVLLAWRATLGRAIDRAFAGDAPLARALLIADQSGVDPALRDRYAQAGIVHMLSISGLHVALVAAAVHLVLLALRRRSRTAMLWSIAITATYVAVIGAPAPAVRAGVMLAVMAVSRVAQRPVSAWGALALGAAAPLVHPATALDPGYQLSVAGIASLIASRALARRWIAPRWDGWRAHLANGLLTSVVASLVTAPIVAWNFGMVSLVAPLTNLAAAPVIAVAQPTLFLALVCAPCPPLAAFVAGAAHPMLVALDAVASAGAAMPGAVLQVAPSAAVAVLAAVAAGALVAACVAPFPARSSLVALGAIATALWLPAAPGAPGVVEVHAIDVGQGDAVAIRTPRGRWILVDAGPSWRGGNAGRRAVIPYLRRRGGALEEFILSHPHTDHVGGAATVLRALHPREYLDGAFAGGSDAYAASLVTARDAGVRWHRVHPGDSTVIDGVVLRILAPDSAWMSAMSDPNDASVVVLVRYGAVRFLLMGDAEQPEEAWLLAHAPDALHADVLKVGHHGSNTSSSPAFLDAVQPRVAMVSVGAGNHYGHPNTDVLRALAAHGAIVLRTDRVGTIVARSDGHWLDLRVGDAEWRVRARSSER
ncbi:MAG TPA: DNA internalization-related competence protein ComEC/Rec2 [Gemmatimonadaceae bacterium]|nr:DNA internalization-related competence protein ComEC/Rec2 [Gemmatimonadaceae bacterium]